MPKVTLSARSISTCLANTLSQKWRKVGLFSPLPRLPIPLDESFQLCKKFLDRIHVRRIWRQVDQYYSCPSTRCRHHIGVMDRGIVHDQDRFRRREPPTIRQKLSYEVFQDNSVRRALEDLCAHDAVLGVRRQDLIALAALETCDLPRSSPTGGPLCASETHTLITTRLVYVDKVIR